MLKEVTLENGRKIVINMDNVEAIIPSGMFCELLMVSGNNFLTKETIESYLETKSEKTSKKSKE